MREVRLEYLRPEEIQAELSTLPLAFLPVGAIEWHGPHLPFGTDVMLAREVAIRIADAVGGVVYPAIFCGTERERPPEMLKSIGFKGDEWIVGMDFPNNSVKSYYYPEETLAIITRQTLTMLVEHGYKLIIIVNGHGSENQINTLTRLAAEFTAQGKARVMVMLPFPEERDEQGRATVAAGHADVYEASAMLALHPETVDLDALPALDHPLQNTEWAVVDGATFSGHPTPGHTVRPANDPRNANAEAGARYFQDIVASMTEKVQDIIRTLES